MGAPLRFSVDVPAGVLDFCCNADIPSDGIEFDGGLAWLVGIGQRRLRAVSPDGRRGGTAPRRNIASLVVGSARARSPWASARPWRADPASPMPMAPAQTVQPDPPRRAAAPAPQRARGHAPRRSARRAVRRTRRRSPANRTSRRRPCRRGRRMPATARDRRRMRASRQRASPVRVPRHAIRSAAAEPSRRLRRNRARRREVRHRVRRRPPHRQALRPIRPHHPIQHRPIQHRRWRARWPRSCTIFGRMRWPRRAASSMPRPRIRQPDRRYSATSR